MDTPNPKPRLADRIMGDTDEKTFTGMFRRLVREVELLEARIETLEAKARVDEPPAS